MSDHFKDLLMLSKRERNGVIFLISLIVVTQVSGYALQFIIRREPVEPLNVSYRSFISDSSVVENEYAENTAEFGFIEETSAMNAIDPFDPNSLDEAGWQRLGFSEKQAAGIVKFREMTGGFKSKSDLKKLYAMTEETYERISPLVLLPENTEYPVNSDSPQDMHSESGRYNKYNFESTVIELNSADTMELKKIRGFGSFTARKIIEYRERLGGFRDVSQLLEVWPIRPGLLDSVETNIRLDTTLMEKMNVNTVDLARLRKHPYISAGQAKALIAFREKHGSFQEITDIKKCVLIDEVTFARLKPYLTR